MLEMPFDSSRLLKTGKLFDSSMEDLSRYAFHGTSTLYSNSIEKVGISKSQPFLDVRLIHDLARSLLKQHHKLIGFLNSVGRASKRISLAPYSLIAADFALERRGGQILQFCRIAISEGGVAPPILQQLLDELDARESCVYAVELAGVKGSDIQFEDGAFQSNIFLEPALLVAKVVIPRDFNRTDLVQLKSKLQPKGASLCHGSMAQQLERKPSDVYWLKG